MSGATADSCCEAKGKPDAIEVVCLDMSKAFIAGAVEQAEAARVNTDVRCGKYVSAGEMPVMDALGSTRQRLSMIATVNNRGKARWMIIGETVNAVELIEFLQLLVNGEGKKVFLILDNQQIHHSKPVKAWMAERKSQIEVLTAELSSVQHNPKKWLNADLKQAIGKPVPANTKAKLFDTANEQIVMLEKHSRA